MLVRRVALGAAAGYVANRAMDAATAWFYERQSKSSKAHEEEVFPGGAILAGGHDVARLLRVEADEARAQHLGIRAHRALGMTYGAIAGMLVGAGMRPMRAGALIGLAAFVAVDEVLNAVQLEPSPFDFPIEAHMRGVIGHATFGIVLGAVLGAVHPLLVRHA